MTDIAKARRAAVGACIALFANMGMNSVFTVFLPVFQTEWGADQIANIALAATFGCLMASACSMFLVGPLLKKLAPRSLFLICAVLAAIYCLLYFSATKVWMLIVAGLFGGVVLAIGTHAMGVAVITPYFASYGKKTPLIVSLVLASAALGAVLCVSGAVITNICPTITPVLFGQRSMNQINSIYSGGAFWGGAALASQVVGRVITGTGSFANGFLTAAVIGVAGMALLFVSLAASPMKKRAKS